MATNIIVVSPSLCLSYKWKIVSLWNYKAHVFEKSQSYIFYKKNEQTFTIFLVCLYYSDFMSNFAGRKLLYLLCTFGENRAYHKVYFISAFYFFLHSSSCPVFKSQDSNTIFFPSFYLPQYSRINNNFVMYKSQPLGLGMI